MKLNNHPKYRQNIMTDNNNIILDIHNIKILNPITIKNAINTIPNVMTINLFTNRNADITLINTPNDIKTIIK